MITQLLAKETEWKTYLSVFELIKNEKKKVLFESVSVNSSQLTAINQHQSQLTAVNRCA